MDAETLKEILKDKDRDFEELSYLKDKSKHIVDEFEFMNCEHCSSKHLKFRCPKLHYIPIAQQVIYKYMKEGRVNQRRNFVR